MELKDIVECFGIDDDYDVFNEQYNFDWLVSENGILIMFVVDSGNNCVVEYVKEDGEWVWMWFVGKNMFNWLCDVDCFFNGNMFIVDMFNY